MSAFNVLFSIGMIWLFRKNRAIPNFLKWISSRKCSKFGKSRIDPTNQSNSEISKANKLRLRYLEQILINDGTLKERTQIDMIEKEKNKYSVEIIYFD